MLAGDAEGHQVDLATETFAKLAVEASVGALQQLLIEADIQHCLCEYSNADVSD